MSLGLAKAFYKKGRVILVEPLGAEVRLGSVGFLSDGQWVEVGTTKTVFGLGLPESGGLGAPNSFDGKGGKGFRFATRLAGEISPLVPNVADAKARAEIVFGSRGSFVMNVKNQRLRSARDLAELMAAIRYAYRFRRELPEGKRWERHYAVIVGLASADSVTALSASSADAAVVVTGSNKQVAPTTPAELEASMAISWSKESVDKLWRGPALGYAFQALRIDPSIFKTWDREDFAFLKPRIGLASARGELPKLKRPTSYVAWGKEGNLSQIKPERVRAHLLAPAGARGTAGTVAELIRSRSPRRNSGNSVGRTRR